MQGGPQVNHASCWPAGKIDFNMGGNLFEQFNFAENNVPMVDGRGDLPEGSAGPDRPSRTSGIDEFEDLQGQAILIGKDGRVTSGCG